MIYITILSTYSHALYKLSREVFKRNQELMMMLSWDLRGSEDRVFQKLKFLPAFLQNLPEVWRWKTEACCFLQRFLPIEIGSSRCQWPGNPNDKNIIVSCTDSPFSSAHIFPISIDRQEDLLPMT